MIATRPAVLTDRTRVYVAAADYNPPGHLVPQKKNIKLGYKAIGFPHEWQVCDFANQLFRLCISKMVVMELIEWRATPKHLQLIVQA